MARRITERFAFEGGTVDRTGAYPVVRGVLLCGPTSANRRRYKAEAFAGDRVKRYNGKPVFLNHGNDRESRRYEDKVGIIENARHRADGMPIGDIAINPKQSHAEAFLHDAEHHPRSCGMSHVAQCETSAGQDGWEDVTELVEAESVDVVVDPATTKGLYESKGRGRRMLTIQQLAESIARHPKATIKQIERIKRLAEMDDLGAMDSGMDAAPPADDSSDPDEAIKSGFKAAIMAVVEKAMTGDMDPKDALKKIKTLLSSHCDATDTTADTTADDDAGDDATPASESRKKSADPFAILAECDKAGHRPGPAELKALSLMTSADRAAYLTEQRSRVPGESPRSNGRNPGSGTAGKTTRTAESQPAEDAKGFLTRVME